MNRYLPLFFVLLLALVTLAACEDIDWYKALCEKPEGWKMKLWCMIYEPDLKAGSHQEGSGESMDKRCEKMVNSHWNPETKDCACNDGYTQQYFTQFGYVCFDKKKLSFCSTIEHAFMDPDTMECKCDDGYKPFGKVQHSEFGWVSESCQPVGKTSAPGGACASSQGSLNRIQAMISTSQGEINQMNSVADRINRLGVISQIGEDPELLKQIEGYDPNRPPYANIPNQGNRRLVDRYRQEAGGLSSAITAGIDPKIEAAKEFIQKGDCSAANTLINEAEDKISEAYWGFHAASCALNAKTRIQKDGPNIISTQVELPPGCDCRDLRFTVVNREFNNAAVLGMMISQQQLRTMSSCKALSGELIQIDNLPTKVVINHYYGKRGLFWIYYETSWIYGQLEPV